MNVRTIILVSALLVATGCLKEAQINQNRVETFSDLYKNGTLIAVCYPGHCPAGRYAEMVITNLESKDPDAGRKIRGNIVTNDPNVRAVLDKIVTGEVDAGFVYVTDAYLEKNRFQIIEIPPDISPLPQYGVAIIKGGENAAEASLFVEFLLSTQGQEVLKEYGFIPAVDEPKPFEVKNLMTKNPITVYAAISLTDAFTEAVKRFEAETGIKVTIGFGSSGTLRQRIEGGAPVDVYATASLHHADLLINEGFIEGYKVFGRNRLVVAALR